MSRRMASPQVPTLLRFWAVWAGGVLKNSVMERCLALDAGCLRFRMLPASSCRHVRSHDQTWPGSCTSPINLLQTCCIC